jgi:hypothetical protein
MIKMIKNKLIIGINKKDNQYQWRLETLNKK